MKHILKIIILLTITIFLAISCSKENSLQKSISGTAWWSEQSASTGGTIHQELTFTGSSFYLVVTFPFTPSYPPSRTTGTYTYTYPNIYLASPDFADVAVIDSDFQSFRLGNSVFLRK